MYEKKYFFVLLLFLIVVSFTGCNPSYDAKKEMDKTIDSESTVSDKVTPTIATDIIKEEDSSKEEEMQKNNEETKQNEIRKENIEEIEYETMIAQSLLSTGNNYRIKKVIEKAKNGEEVNIAYIGGSITEGAGASNSKNCYAYQSYLFFKNTYGLGEGANINFKNGGMGGTPSTLGVIRYDRDITSYGELSPDIVFVEFAVNDYQEPTNGEAYESLIRNILSSPNHPAVILLFSVFQSKWNMQDLYQPLGLYYDLPMISIKDAIVPELTKGTMTDEKFFSDQYHPTDYGHNLMSDCITYFFEKVDAETIATSDSLLPKEAKIGKSFEDIIMIDSMSEMEDIIINPGDFSGKDEEIGRLMYDVNKRTFPDNWKHEARSETENEAESFSMTLTCKSLLFVYKASSSDSVGAVDIYVDGTLVKNLNGSVSSGWNNPITELLIKEETAEEHFVEIRMDENSVNKEFTIMALGYSK